MKEEIGDYYSYYRKMVVSGMFWVWFPKLTGRWEDDMVDWLEWKAGVDAQNL